jgi:hypothetical protein
MYEGVNVKINKMANKNERTTNREQIHQIAESQSQ